MKIKHFVRQNLFFLCMLLPLAHADPLPEIDAYEFDSTPVKKSATGRVYLFQTDKKSVPKTGNVILIQNDGKPAAAFRVMQSDFQKGEFVAKRVRRYDLAGELQLNTSYKTLEKVADLLFAPPSQKVATESLPGPSTPPAEPDAKTTPPPQNEKAPAPSPAVPSDSQKTEKKDNLEVYDYDDDLDKATSPQNLKKNVDEIDDEEAANAKTEFEINENTRLSPMKNSLGIGAGFFRSLSNFSTSGPTNNGFMLLFSRAFAQDILLSPKGVQDDVSLEFGLGYFRQVNINQHNDLYTVTPLLSALRYDIHFSETFTFFVYGGIQYNFIASKDNVSESNSADLAMIKTLQGPQQALGFGFMFNLGPHWYLRMDIGWDRILGGMSIKW